MRSIIPHQENPALREMAHAIPLADIGTAKIKKLITDMKSLMAREKFGVAIAAAQVGEPLAMFIVSGKAIAIRASNKNPEMAEEVADEEAAETPDQVYINPVLTKVSRGRKEKHEGCLSIRGKWGMVPRAEKATVTAYDEHGKKFTRGASGFLAHIFQHEMDHLKGVLYIDKAKDLYDETLDESR